MLVALFIIAMMASTASAGMQLERFEDFLSDRSYPKFILLVNYQLWAFLSPFLRGPLNVVLEYIWNNGSYAIEYESNSTVTLNYADMFPYLGIGNLNQLQQLFFETVPLIIANQLLSTNDKLSYGAVFEDIKTRLKIDV